MHAPFLACIRSRKNKTARASGRLFEETRFRNSVFRASSGSAAQGTVASPGPVAGSDVTIGPLLMLVHLLAAVLIVVNGTPVLSLRRSVGVVPLSLRRREVVAGLPGDHPRGAAASHWRH